jgi:UDP-glucose 4-epimerase
MDKFLVTGGAGFIGSNICTKLISQGCFVRVIDNLLTGKKSNLAAVSDKIEFIEADMGNQDAARAAMKGIDVVLHQGALPSVPRSVDDPAATHRHCVDATFTLLLAARDAKVKRFVYAASSSAYGDTPTLPKVETMPVNPAFALRGGETNG